MSVLSAAKAFQSDLSPDFDWATPKPLNGKKPPRKTIKGGLAGVLLVIVLLRNPSEFELKGT